MSWPARATNKISLCGASTLLGSSCRTVFLREEDRDLLPHLYSLLPHFPQEETTKRNYKETLLPVIKT